MLVRKRRLIKLLFVFGVLAVVIVTLSPASANQPAAETAEKTYKQYLPTVFSSSASVHSSGQDLINQLRANAGVAAVSYSPILEKNCLEHSRYMAENGILSHEQDPNYPYASSNGQICARQANIWLGSSTPAMPWEPDDVVRDWMDSVPHRIWLLYPTSEQFGFAFYSSQATNHTAAALDILSGANFGADEAYAAWPVRYPGSGEKGIPATRYPITLNWRYFGPEPVLEHVRLTTADGRAIAHDAKTQMSTGHKGIQIIPKNALPLQSKIMVSVTGHYDGAPFSYSWHFYTGTTQYASHSTETLPGS